MKRIGCAIIVMQGTSMQNVHKLDATLGLKRIDSGGFVSNSTDNQHPGISGRRQAFLSSEFF